MALSGYIHLLFDNIVFDIKKINMLYIKASLPGVVCDSGISWP